VRIIIKKTFFFWFGWSYQRLENLRTESKLTITESHQTLWCEDSVPFFSFLGYLFEFIFPFQKSLFSVYFVWIMCDLFVDFCGFWMAVELGRWEDAVFI